MNTRVIPAIGLNLARRCRSVLLAQLYYAERELLLCCGVLSAFLGFFGAEGVFDSLPLELFADTCLRSKLNFLFENRSKKCHFFSQILLILSKFEISLEFVDFRADFYRDFTKSCRIKKQIFAENMFNNFNCETL